MDSPNLQDSTIVSCGLGENASFDVEFASRFHAKVILVDPTPRAVLHFNQISRRIGYNATAAYSESGKQLAEAYDLSALTPGRLVLVDRALWTACEPVKLFLPDNPEWVSHSIVNRGHDDETTRDSIAVDAISIDELMRCFGLHDLPLLKLDIEGAEIEVIADMLEKRIFPGQILVEYDEFLSTSRASIERIEVAHSALLDCGYRLIHFDHPSNCLYARMAIA
jgi:FkbM family methyltransferase